MRAFAQRAALHGASTTAIRRRTQRDPPTLLHDRARHTAAGRSDRKATTVMLTTAHAYEVIATADAARAPIGQVIVTDAKLGDGEAEYEWPTITEHNGSVRIATLFTCRYVGAIALARGAAA